MNSKILRIVWWTLFVIVALVVVAIRIRLLGIPLERDEGEYAYAGQLMLEGIPPYQLAYNMKFPGTYAAYALIMSIFGQTTFGVHLGLLIVNLTTIVLIFFIGRRLFDEIAGLAAAASYAILSVSPSVLGFAGHATHFVVLPVAGGALLLLSALDRQANVRIFLSGILFGVAVLMKQPGAAFVVFGLIFLLLHSRGTGTGVRTLTNRTAIFLGASTAPLVVTGLALWYIGVFEKFWFWCVQYALTYGTRVSLSLGAQIFAHGIADVIGTAWVVWTMAAIGLGTAVWKVKTSLSHVFLMAFFIFGLVATCAGLYFREHYFIFLLPAVCLSAGAIVSRASQIRLLRFLAPAVVAGAVALPMLAEREFFFSLSLDAAARHAYGWNPFPEAVRVADFLREHTQPEDTIAVLGSEPEICFYAHRRSASGYIYTYALMEPHRFAAQMQEEMIREIEKARPKYLVYVVFAGSWTAAPESKRTIFEWFGDYEARELKPVGLVNIISLRQTDYYLPYQGESFTPSDCQLMIYERKL